jgi:hypothetical protein
LKLPTMSSLSMPRLWRQHSLQNLDIQLSGASQPNVQADKTIAARLSGTSGLTYTTTPRTTTPRFINHGVTIRRQGLSDEQVAEAATLYTAGKSLAWLGARYGVSHTTVAAALRRRGMTLRPRPGSV